MEPDSNQGRSLTDFLQRIGVNAVEVNEPEAYSEALEEAAIREKRASEVLPAVTTYPEPLFPPKLLSANTQQPPSPSGLERAQTPSEIRLLTPPPLPPEPILAPQPEGKTLRNALVVSLLTIIGVAAISLMPEKQYDQLASLLSTIPEDQKIAALEGAVAMLIFANIYNLTRRRS